MLDFSSFSIPQNFTNAMQVLGKRSRDPLPEASFARRLAKEEEEEEKGEDEHEHGYEHEHEQEEEEDEHEHEHQHEHEEEEEEEEDELEQEEEEEEDDNDDDDDDDDDEQDKQGKDKGQDGKKGSRRRETKVLEDHTWKCGICQATFHSIQHMYDHAKDHTIFDSLDHTFKCPMCELRCSRRHNVQNHFLNQHSGVNSVRCLLCNIDVVPGYAKRHVQRQHPGRSYLPSKRVQDSPPYRAPSTKTRQLRSTPAAENYDRCPYCKEAIPLHQLVTHLHTVHPPKSDKTHECTLCHVTFSQRWELLRHKEECHSSLSETAPSTDRNITQTDHSYTCKVCKRTFQESHHLLRHEKSFRHGDGVHHPVRMPCDICGETLWDLTNLVPHVKQTHPEQYLEWCWKEDNESYD
ncbi:hypothetical protein BCR43DRAFT_491890 [Syncephalastrum racemosum]|uniref:C2H2-type domain-containing protein n=1 Tax=Syncephalastrum racemosum TaxID=13706 RepID=A0A1X2HDZ6_SYNRA|nr:hypothetical protein BCR43DRAFT_491890 [Syncephalastrum racemosum]